MEKIKNAIIEKFKNEIKDMYFGQNKYIKQEAKIASAVYQDVLKEFGMTEQEIIKIIQSITAPKK